MLQRKDMNVKRLLVAFFFLFPCFIQAQVNTVEFGRNRVQFKKMNWKYYQSPNFNTYFNQGGLELGKFVAQVAEDELMSVEDAVEYSLQRRANIVVYNSYDEFKQSNIGAGIDWQNPGGVTKLVNNKMVLFFDGNHVNLRKQIREGIAKILTDNILFGDDIGEFASNQALLDLPKWLTDGYIKFIAEPWNTDLDDDLKVALLSGDYKTFYHFAFAKPELAGHAFWYFISTKYKKENVTYFLYLARLYKNLNNASQRITKKKFKEVLKEFMDEMSDRYFKDLRNRRNAPRGRMSVVEETSPTKDLYRFNVNPNNRVNSYGVVSFKKGIYKVNYVDQYQDAHTLLKKGFRVNQGDINPNYPILAWDGKGTRLLTIYWENGKIKMFVYDAIANYKRNKQVIEGIDQILDASFMLDANTVLLSAVKNGYTDIFIYKIEQNKLEQVTNDVYDDLNPTFVSFPNRSGIIWSSNRPSGDAVSGDTVLPSKYPFNIFITDILNKNNVKQISQLSNVKNGANAMYPMQYNVNHFTFVSDENGIANRWAGFFATQRNGVDTLYYIGDELLRNPSPKEMDSTLRAWQRDEADSIAYFQIYRDSTYTFPITNYQSSLQETRIAGNNGQVSEVRREGDLKFLYKLQVDSMTLRNRNVNARPTEFMKKVMETERLKQGKAIVINKDGKQEAAPAKKKDVFQSEFENEKVDSATAAQKATLFPEDIKIPVLRQSKLFNYKYKFSADYILSGVTNNVLVNRYQPYQGGQGPVQLNNGNDVNWSFRVGVSDLMEDIKFIGGYRFGTNLSDKDVFFTYLNNKRRLDWGVTYYRSKTTNYPGFFKGPAAIFDNVLITSLYQGQVSYPFNEVKSLRAQVALRLDRGVVRPYSFTGFLLPSGLAYPDSVAKTIVARIEYVHDNTLNPAQNIWNGLRWKVYLDMNTPIEKNSANKGKFTYNIGFDARHYMKIYRNFIWAVRAAGDASFGSAKMIYYLGGVDGWINPKFNNANQPDPTENYSFQTLAVNVRGFDQNIANGNNALVINSELRLPVFSTFFNRPVNNAFLRNFQLVQFVDLGTAWAGEIKNISRPEYYYSDGVTPITVRLRAGGIGPFAGGYGFGARSTLLGYFIKVDAAWEMKGVFRGKPMWYFALGLDF